MKVHPHRFLKYCTALLVLLLLVTNCEREEFDPLTEEKIQNSPRSKITLESFKNRIKSEQYDALSQNFDINIDNQKKTSLQNKTVQNSNIIITDTIHQYQTDNGYSFTFLITKPQDDPNKIYNLIVELDSIGNVINAIDVEYIPTEEWLENPNTVFKGSVSAKQSNIDLNAQFSNRSTRCYQPHIVWTCFVGKPHHPGHPNCRQNTFYADVIMVSMPCLPDDYFTDFDPSSSSNSYYTGNGPAPYINTIGGGNPVTNPFFKTPRQIKTDYILERLGDKLSFTQANWLGLNAMFEILDKLETYLENNDSEEAETFAAQAIEAWMEQRLVSFSPLIKYPQGSNYSTKYPKLTEYLKNQLPKTGEIPKIVNTIKEISGISEEQIINDLKWGHGPALEIIQLDNYSSNTSDKTVGAFDKLLPNTILLDIDYVEGLENGTNSQIEEDGLLFYLGVVILHEYVHYTDNIDGQDFPGEEGEIFEIRAYGQTISPSIAQWIIIEKYY